MVLAPCCRVSVITTMTPLRQSLDLSCFHVQVGLIGVLSAIYIVDILFSIYYADGSTNFQRFSAANCVGAPSSSSSTTLDTCTSGFGTSFPGSVAYRAKCVTSENLPVYYDSVVYRYLTDSDLTTPCDSVLCFFCSVFGYQDFCTNTPFYLEIFPLDHCYSAYNVPGNKFTAAIGTYYDISVFVLLEPLSSVFEFMLFG